MRKRNTPTRLAALLAAALLFAPLPAPAQRRQRQRPTPAPARPSAAPPRAAAPAQPRRAEPERPIEELLPAGGFGLYAEARRVGTLFNTGEVATGMAALRLLGNEAAEMVAVADFVNRHSELLADARLVVAGLPTRPDLPHAVAALELATPEAAAGFEQQYRAFLTDGAKAIGLTPPDPPPARAGRGRGAARQAARPRPAGGVTVRRVGRWLVAGNKPFTLARLRPAGTPSLAEDSRFLSYRNRFASEQLFLFFDTERATEGYMLMVMQEQEEREKRERAEAAAAPQPTPRVEVAVVAPAPTPEPTPETAETAVTPPALTAEDLLQDVEPVEMQTQGEGAEGEQRVVTGAVGVATDGETPVVEPPSEEQQAARRMNGLMRNLWGGIPRWPGAVAAAANLEGGYVAFRVAVERTPDGNTNLIPFLPNVVSGPAVANEAAGVAPADGDVFVSASLDWSKIFDSLIGTAKDAPARQVTVSGGPRGDALAEGGEYTDGEGKESPSPEETLAEVEKVFGFKIREDLLPAFGSEVALSFPLTEVFFSSFRVNPEQGGEGEEEAAAKPGFLVLVALNDTDKVRRLLPRALALFGAAPLGAQAQAETREGFEIRNVGHFAYAFINNHLVLGRVEQVRHAADSFAAHRTLASTGGYRDATAWQARQKLVQAYVSEGLMRHAIEESKRQAGGSTNPLVLALVSQLEVEPKAASLASTDEGEVVVHELRLPLDLIKVFSAGAMIGIQEAPVIGGEMSAVYALSSLRSAQESYRGREGRERFATLEELTAEGLLEEEFAQRVEYDLEISASGDKFEVKATPKNYGKTGRRSFFLDETGIIRAADHKGKAASAQDPPID